MEYDESNSLPKKDSEQGVVDVKEPEVTTEPSITKTEIIHNRVKEAGEKMNSLLGRFDRRLIFLVIVVIGIVVALLLQKGTDQHIAIKQFANVYSFVPEKISRSAAIPIRIPEGVTEEALRASLTFNPEVDGSWRAEDEPDVAIFEPKQPLKSGVYYAVNLDTGSVQLSGDFYVDEDPMIQAIFPGEGTEAHEDTEITIVFNRPMVPLTTLSEQESIELPITITPPTEGRFKWISTRNLQFIPESTLIPSSDYTVAINEGLVSLDGLPIAPVTHTFVTRPLRYGYVSDRGLGYRSPIIITFNQPVDLAKTEPKIVISRDEKRVAVDVEYGKTTRYDRSSRKYVEEEDQSKLFVYQEEDTHGRDRFWDFDTTYKVAISGAVPLAGTKELTEGRHAVVSVPNIVKNVTAQSERSSEVRPDLFDPQGTLTVNFYEDINLDRSNISVKGLEKVTYGERCKTEDDGQTVYLGSSCEKEQDKSTLIFDFKDDAFSVGESFTLELKKVVSADGLTLTAEPVIEYLKVYPALSIYRTDPPAGAIGADLTGIYVCTNTPLRDPGEEGILAYVKANGYIIFGEWSDSFFVESSYYGSKCSSGQFQTYMHYGIVPRKEYTFTLDLTDEFGQTASQQISFTSGEPNSTDARFRDLQLEYNVTTPERTKLTYAVENLEYVDMHICRLEPETFLERVTDRADIVTPPSDAGCSAVVTKRIELPPKYWVLNYFQVDLAEHFADTRGHYILTFSHPQLKSYYYKKQEHPRTYVSVTNLAVGKKEVLYDDGAYARSKNPAGQNVVNETMRDTQNLYWINDNQSLTPISGAVVTQYAEEGNDRIRRASSGTSNWQGVAEVAVEKKLVGAVVRAGLDTAIISDWADSFGYTRRVESASRTYVYTDRPIYRPGQTVYIKGIDRIGFDGSYEVWNKQPVTLKLTDAMSNDLYEVQLPVNEYGTFNTEFTLPQDATLGNYRIEVLGQTSSFSVEEYVPAAFKLETATNKEEYLNGETMQLEVQADYYFGVPLSEGTVSYSVTAQDYYFDRYEDEYFNFGRSWYYCYSCGYGDDFLFRGEADLNENGHAVITRELNFNDLFDNADDESSKLLTVWVTAKDVSGRSVSTQRSFIVHKGDFYLGSRLSRYFTAVNSPLELKVKTVDVEGQPVAQSDIDRAVYRVKWETYKRQEVDGGFYYRSEKKLEQISQEKIKTNREGNWQGELSFAEEGEYEVHVSKRANNGALITSVSNVYIYGSRSVTVPPRNNYELDLEVNALDVEVGDTASLLIKAPYDNAKVLITAERGVVHDYWVVDLKGGLYSHELPIKAEYAPNIYLSALLLSGDPEIKFGTVELAVGSDEHDLAVSVTANKANYLPGEAVTLSVETKDAEGRPVPAEVSVAVADLSVLALKGNPKKNPTIFFYDGFPLSVSTASNIKNILHEKDIPLGTKGGDGADPDDLAKKKRGIFKDTAHWEAVVRTDQTGRATVTFTLPDNLTTWQVETLGVTIDTKLGVDYLEFKTKKDLMAVPLKPRFVVPGDTFSLGAKIFNQTDKGRNITVSLESSSLRFTGEREDKVFVNAGESKTVYFAVVAPEDKRAGEHLFTFTATDGEFVDAVEQTISITPNRTHETVATANFTKAEQATEYVYIPKEVLAGAGGLTINANATLAVFMTDALSYMVTYPYGCSEQLSSSLSTIAILTNSLKVPNVEGQFETIEHEGVTYTVSEVVERGLAQVYETQTAEGGFAYYKGLDPSLWLTMHVVTTLAKLQEAGFPVRQDVIDRAAQYIETDALSEYRMHPTWHTETVITAEYVLRTAVGREQTTLSEVVQSLITNNAFLNEQVSSLSLAYLTILTTYGYGQSYQDMTYDALKNRIDIDGRGAYLTSTDTVNRRYFENSIKNTALLLKAFVAQDDEHPVMGNVLRWLLASRDRDGAWGGTHNTFNVVDAMVEYLTWQKETTAHFSLTTLLAGEPLFEHEFNPTNVFETYTHFTSIDLLRRSELLPIELKRKNISGGSSNLYYDITLKYYLPVEQLPPRDEGITITRGLYKLDDVRDRETVATVSVGEVLRGKLTVTIPEVYSHVAIEDMIPAGFELVNFNLSTEDRSLLLEQEEDEWGMDEFGSKPGAWWSSLANLFGSSQTAQSYRSYWYGGSYDSEQTRKLYPTHTESHDDRLFLYVEEMYPGVYEYEYFIRALVPGEFQHLPARAEELFFPEVFGRTEGGKFTVTAAQ